jgi:hypothetical protein
MEIRMTEYRTDHTYIDICVDCLMRCEQSEPINETHEFAFQKGIKEYGAMPNAEFTVDGDLLASFGKSPCEFCQSPLFGDRYLATIPH